MYFIFFCIRILHINFYCVKGLWCCWYYKWHKNNRQLIRTCNSAALIHCPFGIHLVLFVCLLFWVPLENILHLEATSAPVKGCQIKDCAWHCLWAGRDLYRAIPAATQGFEFCVLVGRTVPLTSSKVFWGPILNRSPLNFIYAIYVLPKYGQLFFPL